MVKDYSIKKSRVLRGQNLNFIYISVHWNLPFYDSMTVMNRQRYIFVKSEQEKSLIMT